MAKTHTDSFFTPRQQACYAERFTCYSKSVRLSVRLSVTRWHCVNVELHEASDVGREREKNQQQIRWRTQL